MKTTMTTAHEIKRNAAAKWNCAESEIVFGICLKMAWKGEKIMADVVDYQTEGGAHIKIEIRNGRLIIEVNEQRVSAYGIENGCLVLSIGRLPLTDEVEAIYSKYKTVLTASRKKAHKPGYCYKCGSYCYGDCTAN